MKTLRIDDRTLCIAESYCSFREKLETARLLARTGIDTLELPAVSDPAADGLLVRTISAFAKNCRISVATGLDADGIENAFSALSAAAHPVLRVEVPLSAGMMEYVCHVKAPKMADYITNLVSTAKAKGFEVEFFAEDATRAERDFLLDMLETACKAGADCVTVSDLVGLLPDEIAVLAADCAKRLASYSVNVGVSCVNKNGLATAAAVLSVKDTACPALSIVKTSVSDDLTSLETFGDILKNRGNDISLASGLHYTELKRLTSRIAWILGGRRPEISASLTADDGSFQLDEHADPNDVAAAISRLGYDLADEDMNNVLEEFRRVAANKKVGAKDLEAIVASTALQVPPTYTLVDYVINSANIFPASAQITLQKNGEILRGISIGDGPIDAAILAFEQIIGRSFEMDDFQIQSVTEGKEAVGNALVRLRAGGKLYSGNGISTDIIGAGIRAYLNAVNKIIYGEV